MSHLIAVAGTIDFATREGRDAAVADSVAGQASTRDDEPGCLAYSFCADPVVDTRVQVHELWADEASLAAHFAHPNYLGLREVLATHARVASSVTKMRVDLREPVYDETHTPRADFFTATD